MSELDPRCIVLLSEYFFRRSVASAWAWLPLIYDTAVLLLIVHRTLTYVRLKTAGKVARVLLRDGVLYYRSALADAIG